jgi:tetratricopeptide (TPR) repeat protein
VRNMRKASLLVASLAGLALGGCDGGGKTFGLTYERAPQYEVPAGVKRLAVADFVGKTPKDKRSAELAADKLSSELDICNRKFKRYQLVDRRRLAEILNERDRQIAIADSSEAVRIGKIADVQAMIYGSIQTDVQERSEMRPSMTISGRPTEKLHRKIVGLVVINFTLDDVGTGKTLVAKTFTRDYDSDKPKGGQSGWAKVGSVLGVGGDSLPTHDQVVNGLIDEAVREFIVLISPHEVVIKEKLAGGDSKAVKDGNEYAGSKEYADALKCYLQGVKEKPNDHGAMFNAGLMYEAQRDFKNAELMYDKANSVKVDKKYIDARRRVRGEMQN